MGAYNENHFPEFLDKITRAKYDKIKRLANGFNTFKDIESSAAVLNRQSSAIPLIETLRALSTAELYEILENDKELTQFIEDDLTPYMRTQLRSNWKL